MFCVKCGKQLPDDARFCDACGEKMPEQPKETQVAEQPVIEGAAEINNNEVVAETPVAATVPQGNPAAPFVIAPEVINAAPVKKKKKGGLIALLISIAVVIIAAAVAIAFNWRIVAGTFLQIFAPDEDYMRFVVKEAVSTHVDDFLDAYEPLSKGKTEGWSRDIEANVTVNDDFKTVMQNYFPGININDLATISADGNFNYVGSMAKFTTDLSVGNKFITTFSSIWDYGLYGYGTQYIAFPKIDAKYKEYGYSSNYDFTMGIMEAADHKVIKRLANKYSVIALDCIDNVTKENVNVKVEGISQNLTRLDIKIDAETMYEITKAVLSEIEDDEDFEELMRNYTEMLEDNGYITNANKVYNEIFDGIEELLDDIDDDYFEGLDEYRVQLYVNAKQQIVGCEVTAYYTYRDYDYDIDGYIDYNSYTEVEGKDVIVDYITLRKGDEFATRIAYYENLELVGKGTDKNGIINAEFELNVSDRNVLSIDVKDFNKKLQQKEGKYSGTLLISPSKDVLGNYSENLSAISLAEPKIEINLTPVSDGEKIAVSLVSGSKKLVTVDISLKKVEATDIDSFDYESPSYENRDQFWSEYWSKVIADISSKLGY